MRALNPNCFNHHHIHLISNPSIHWGIIKLTTLNQSQAKPTVHNNIRPINNMDNDLLFNVQVHSIMI
jgi:hypothetical protein